jgi:hypothetical protein
MRRCGQAAQRLAVRQEDERMAYEQSAEQVKAEYLENLGPKLGPVFSELMNDLAWLQVKWAEYRELFGTTPERIELLNSATGLFFRILQDTLWEDALLHLCRLTDPATMGGKHNLTIQTLPELCDDPTLKGEVTQLVNDAIVTVSFARDWRNRRIGHRDLSVALGSATRPLAPGSRADVSKALTSIHLVLNHIHERLLNSTLADKVITPATGAEALLYVIRDGLEADAARRDRIRRGKFTQDDLRHRAV